MRDKRIDLKAILCHNVTVFLRKTLSSFFRVHEKLETAGIQIRQFVEDHLFGDDINVTFISSQPVPWILNNLIHFINFINII